MTVSVPLLHGCLVPATTPILTLNPSSSSISRLRPTPFSPLRLTFKPKPKSNSNSNFKSSTIVMARNNPSSSPPATDRLISVVSYTLPFFNSLQYGRYLLARSPTLVLLFEPIFPFFAFYRSIPYSSFVAFFALYLGVVRNPTTFNHYVRFNAMQAVTLDVLLVIPLFLHRIFAPGRAGIGFRVMVWAHNAIFVFSVLCFLYSVVSCVLGRTPYLPFVADAASRQI